jgi:peptidoglycan hydrolase-like protein with peptidoglycan-binding domain
MASDKAIDRLRAGGILQPQVMAKEAEAAGLGLEYAAALLMKETTGGHNVFGHDRDKHHVYIFPAKDGTVKVTRDLYREYKKRRAQTGLCQGVGPCQLTAKFLQDWADREGGCWKPEINMRVGFRHLVDLMKDHGEATGIERYNGSGQAARDYRDDMLKRIAAWRAVLGGEAKPMAPVPAGDKFLRLGSEGPRVERMTRRLARLRSKRGAAYLAKPRRTFDSAVENALRAFQAEHRLDVDGIYGPLTQRKLNRAVRLQQHKPKPVTPDKQPTPVPAGEAKPAKRPRVTMKSLVGEVHRLDAETGEAWERLVVAAAKRRRLRDRLAGGQTAAAGANGRLDDAVVHGFEAVTAALKEIDATLDTLVALETAEAAEEAKEREAAAATVAVASVEASPAAYGPGGVVTVTEIAPPPPPATEGPAPPSPAAGPPPPPARRALTDLADAELLERIDKLDRAIDRSRAVLIKRMAQVEKDIARLAPDRAQPGVGKPAPNGKPVVKPHAKAKPKPAKPGPKPVRPATMSEAQVRELQTALNTFTSKYLKSFGKLTVDGERGVLTKKRTREAKFYLGYTGTERKSAKVDETFLKRLRKPRSARFSPPAMIARGVRRRRRQEKAAKLSLSVTTGVARFDAKPVAAWMVPYLQWARENGWRGEVISGYRDPAHSERVCMDKCGAPTCSGTCAGRTSNHAGSVKPRGALDVSDHLTFAALMKRCPHQPPIFNALGARDPNHFSASGR